MRREGTQKPQTKAQLIMSVFAFRFNWLLNPLIFIRIKVRFLVRIELLLAPHSINPSIRVFLCNSTGAYICLKFPKKR